MYLNFFKMNKEPFNVTPDPDFLFLSPSHKEALAAVIYGIKQKKGFIAIIGEVGVGKTTIIRSYLDRADREQLKLIYLFNANISFIGLLKSVLRELGLNISSEAPFDMVTQLHQYLISEYCNGRTVVLIIDEAQNMPVETLENLRMLSNLETTKDKLIQIVFSAQPEFEELLEKRELRQLKQRIAVKATIQPLSSDESLGYIRHRLAKVTADEKSIFAASALRLIASHAKGIPRVMNMLCDNCLVTSYGKKRNQVSRQIVAEIIADMGKKSERAFCWSHLVTATILVCTVAGIYLALEPAPLRMSATGSLAASSGPTPEPVPTERQESAAIVEETPATDSVATPDPVARVVKKGDTLAGLVVDTYGYTDRSVFELVKKNNPTIKDANRIIVGDKIVFPVAGR